MKALFQGEDVWTIVTGKTHHPLHTYALTGHPQIEALEQAWEKKDKLAIRQILSHVPENTVKILSPYDYSAEMWAILREMYGIETRDHTR